MTDIDPLGSIDAASVAEFWQRFVTATGQAPDAVRTDAWQFGDSAELADSLLLLVTQGPKRATAGSLADYEAEGELPPTVGDLNVLCDGAGVPRAVIETTEVRIGPMSSVDDRFAWDEGEGDRTRADWLRMHNDYFARRHAQIGAVMHDDIAVVFERFGLLYAEPFGS